MFLLTIFKERIEDGFFGPTDMSQVKKSCSFNAKFVLMKLRRYFPNTFFQNVSSARITAIHFTR
jgi:hypothetical protein